MTAGGQPSDEQLVAAFKAGQTDAFVVLMERYRRMVYFVALKMVKTHDDADDVAQQTFISMHKNLAKFRGDSSVKTWIYRMTSNFAKNRIRDRGRHEGEEVDERLPVGDDNAEERMAQDDERRLLADAVETLPPRQKEVLRLRVHQELSFAEIADALGVSVSSAKVNYHYAVRSLQRRLAGESDA